MPDSPDSVRTVALRSIEVMAAGSLADFTEVVAPGAVNRESHVEPLACRVGGPEGFHASALWLRAAFDDIHHRVEHCVVEGDLAAVDTTMSGHQTGNFVTYDDRGAIDTLWAPTGKTFAVKQTHWLRVTDGLVAEHWATRDDLGQGFQLGWVPPSPAYLLRCAAAKRRAVRAS